MSALHPNLPSDSGPFSDIKRAEPKDVPVFVWPIASGAASPFREGLFC
jgi:hypothetical protein